MPDTNIPTLDLSAALDPSAIAAWLDYELAGPAVRRNDLMAAFQRFADATHAGIADDAVVMRATDFAKQLKAAAKDIDDIRARIKAPVLHAQRLIDGAAKKIADDLAGATRSVEIRIAAYLTAKEAAIRAAAEEDARALARAAEDAIACAQATNMPDDIDAAVHRGGAARPKRRGGNAAGIDPNPHSVRRHRGAER